MSAHDRSASRPLQWRAGWSDRPLAADGPFGHREVDHRARAPIDGTLPEALAGGWHLRVPFLWLQSDGQQQASYLHVRDRLLAGFEEASC